LTAFNLALVSVLSLLGILLFYTLFRAGFTFPFLKGVFSFYLGFVLVAFPLNMATLFFSSILLGKQNLIAFNVVESFRLLCNLIFQIFSFWLSGGMTGALVSWVTANAVAFLLSIWYLRKDFYKPWQFPSETLIPILGYGIKSYPVNFLNLINTRLDTFLVNIFNGARQVGLYTTSVSMAEILWFMPNAMGNTVFPKIPTLEKTEADHMIARACRQTILVMLFLLVIAAISGPTLIRLIYGPEFSFAGIPFLWLLPGVMGLGITRVLAAGFNGGGKPLFTTYSSLAAAAMTIILDLLLIPKYGILGAALASSLAYLTSAIVLIILFIQHSGFTITGLLLPTRQDYIDLVEFGRTLVVKFKRQVIFHKG
jgi:O-antigen/teichoic acid export membrane protein